MTFFQNYNLNRPAWLLPSRIDEPPIEGLRDLLLRLMQGKNLSRPEARILLNQLLQGEATDAQISAALVALAIKGETTEELAGMAEAMRENSMRIKSIHTDFIDTAGTGSSRVKTFNVSTAAAFVIAGAGLPVAKHGSRAATSKSGSADVLTALGVNVSASRETSEKCLNELGICFMFAPLYHASTARVAAVRRELGVHTTFNLLGPMTNPANAPFQIMGVWHKDLVAPIAETHQKLGTKRALVVHGLDGLDEITVSAKSSVAEITPEYIKFYEVSPEDFGFQTVENIENLRGGDAAQNAQIIKDVLENKRTDAARTLVLMNAAAAIFVGGKAGNLSEAAKIAAESLESGKALEKLENLIETTK
ncbi:MAG TPA: anthranilate phosphoribosyltransferase [Pyrinomonadaceae bacterium]|jgi:anthranilate phosphoribosyltransferase|nr:anthranilate phosphoribosyltransferase [Pyrinomonadaceae bacterium]